MATSEPSLRIRLAGPEDATGVLAMMDGIMDWLLSLGRTAQWGTTYWSAVPARVNLITDRIARRELRVAETEGGEIAGILSVSETPGAYIRPAEEPELFINLLATSREFKGQNVGGLLIATAKEEARRRGHGLMRVDCFAGDDGRLKRWYASQGFKEVEPFTVQRETGPDWPGMLFAMHVA
ncbi:GNAT family N-acetyltransferase [Streptacidiphilus fuscans]|uniref:GNAT family N-acetyltransferase n=1 Tax=Streptacidiphilus fuscans TaxID=2789292 RepID=A0A931B0M3_9ACTN|nr:GNAT family N-acetyltransferase [Streptacidiphilus fuscans]MBF9068053.1 GNAT family N-acetyltransferase [Streptacidiphilus fuscans]